MLIVQHEQEKKQEQVKMESCHIFITLNAKLILTLSTFLTSILLRCRAERLLPLLRLSPITSRASYYLLSTEKLSK